MKISGWVFPKINWLSIVLKQSVIFQSLLEQCIQQKNYGKFCNPFIALYPKNNNTILLIHLKGVSRWCKATDNIIQRFNETVVFYVFIMHVVFWGFNSTNIEESPVGVLAQQQNDNIFRTTRLPLNAFFVIIPWCHFITPKKKNWMNFCWEFICKIFMKMISLSRASYSLISSYNSKKDTVNVELKMKYKIVFN